MTKYHRNYRPIEQDDIDAATRGLAMTTASDERLQEIVQLHRDADNFASAVIYEAAVLEMGRRVARQIIGPADKSTLH